MLDFSANFREEPKNPIIYTAKRETIWRCVDCMECFQFILLKPVQAESVLCRGRH